jgi:uncharacterized protein YbjT (DUF2867 family)
MIVTIAGASGFIGTNLIKKLLVNYKVNGLSRSGKIPVDGLTWVETDLFSSKSINSGLANANVAIYLVHSMLPSSKLFQGNFQDTDLLIADNFAKACINNNVQQIIYMGGLVPVRGASKHLDSRKEVEEVFKSTGIPLTILRSGMVVGNGGSSFEILKNLVLNLPGMLLPRWTESTTQTIYIDDLTSVISKSINNENFFNKTVNVVNGERISYADLLKQTAKYLGTKKLWISVPINYTSLSKLWVKIFGEADYELVSPLIDSLLCDLPSPKVPDEITECIKFRTYSAMLNNISKERRTKSKNKPKFKLNNVRSIQRLSNISRLNQDEVSNEYISWLPRHMRFLVKATGVGDDLRFFMIGFKEPLLILKKIQEEAILDRVKFHIIGGLLTNSQSKGWLEFRIVANGHYTLASINDFIPSLPWYVYKFTQAPIHAAVMKAFGRHLERVGNKGNHIVSNISSD